MQLQIQRAGKSINDFQMLDELKVLFSQQHDCDQLEARILKAEEKGNDSGKSKNKKITKNASQNPPTMMQAMPKRIIKRNRLLQNHSVCIVVKFGHKSDNCWTLEKNSSKRPANFRTANTITKKKVPKAAKEALFTQDQVSEMMNKREKTARENSRRLAKRFNNAPIH
jgi:hypothetical protein